MNTLYLGDSLNVLRDNITLKAAQLKRKKKQNQINLGVWKYIVKKRKSFLSVLVILAVCIIAVNFLSCKDSPEKVSKPLQKTDKTLLVGNWLRTDAGYRILISQVNKDGTLEAQYFNPNPINVGRANWEESSGNLKIVVELRDVNYPGSTYTLNYLPDKDILAGDYYQAVEGITFYVEFTRNK